MKNKNERGLGLIEIALLFVLPWNILLILGAWISNKDHLHAIEEKIDKLSKPKKKVENHVTFDRSKINQEFGISGTFKNDTIS